MPQAPTSADASLVARLGQWLHRNSLLALLATYTLTGIWPGPGIAIREYEIALPGGGGERVSMLLLAVLLFCAAAVINWRQIAEALERPSVLAAGLISVWLGPALLVLLLGPILSRLPLGQSTSGLMIGLALVAAMPVANSSAGWTQNAGGNVAISLALIVLSILLSPLVTPGLLDMTGGILAAADKLEIEKVVTQFSGWSFILWVILPSLAGALFAWGAGAERITRAKPWFRVATLATILLLNYANGSLAVERLWKTESATTLAVGALLSVLACLIGVLLAFIQAKIMGLSQSTLLALVFGLSMKHTGLALVLAGEFLKNEPRAILVVLLTTLAQHLVAAIVDWRLQHVGDFLRKSQIVAPTPASDA